MNRPSLPYLFKRYVDGIITDEERTELFEIIQDLKNDEELKRLMDEVWEDIPSNSVIMMDSASIFHKLSTRRNLQSEKRKRRNKKWLLAAAIIGFSVLSSVILLTLQKPSPISITSVPKEATQFLRLPDGSTVILNENSKIEYPDEFGAVRQVRLQGEAFFDIKHNASKPFVVITEDVMTTVLGTSFAVKAFPSDDITVTVTRGKVKVSKENTTLGILSRDQQIIVERQTSSVQQLNVSAKEAMNWMERDIHFNDVSMADAASELANRFGVEINFENEDIRECRFTATFVKGEDIEQIMLVLTEFNSATFSFDREKGRIDIIGGKCSTEPNPNPNETL